MIGGIVGYANGSVDSSVNNCISLGTVSSAATGDTLGSIIGSITRGKVINCYGVSKDKVVCGKVNATYATVTVAMHQMIAMKYFTNMQQEKS